ncbi:RES family NAD+ phosphorylase [Mucilaginibacter rubeus]|uniref:RES family NAD+ phosphorylase n=1 Tax=Mucilaginibacter rubeus TaxID=2027860 RepID=A0AAE6JI09_9SPHI|nr:MULTISPECIES: RES family NAD+ phosphorylase [Mucilaginibacter]QEM05147.1 RES family NAD+ phosphorylase [Mucilaginibacter rubeus]QEM17739.1 RES family NAD+ phosphorylase [Mucilaginibacter gossypii]QTE45734.1 RES family NAD+ phosphorylase [Mucilaginibacter rubeus]QTE52331.1 RES family NAD+ phosphorylase [Mucilaginibacter rubeus]QTE57420.1 RES family NAD+ phosphorylase [Mucilaginibacter rubeus]
MILYRITKCNYAAHLSGTGARLYGGRWNSEGKPMLYLASSRSLAVLEVLVHLGPLIIPGNYCLTEIEVSDSKIITVETEQLPADWGDLSGPLILRQLGDAFLKKQEYLLMKVTSSIVPAEYNYLLNPLHPDAFGVKL